MDLDDLDPLTLSLVVQLHLEDLRDLAKTTNRKGKGRDGEVPDLCVALEAYHHDLSDRAQLLADRAMSLSIARAVELDATEIRSLEAEEERATRDREMALSLSGAGSAPQRRATTTGDEQQMLANLRSLNIISNEIVRSPGLVQAESSSWAASRRSAASSHVLKREKGCVACGDEYYSFDIVTCAGCPHGYCRECLQSLFQAAMTDETLFPPKCCGTQIPIDICRSLLPPQLVGEFHAKKIEFDTPNRTYCSKSSCSAFVPPQAIRDGMARCVRCRTATCATCKKAAHANTDCPDDPATQELLRLAQAEGWQRCYSCARFVELNHGCNHITCRCSAQFCYVCGECWKTCTCPQWEEDRLLARANAIVNRNLGAPQVGLRRENLVERQRQNLIANHQCEHRVWGSRSGSHQCEECFDTLPRYIYECRQCRIMACRRCRYNRLAL